MDDSNKNSVTVRKKDVKEQFYKSSGKGGQHRNKVETAVRLTHNPTGITVIATEERSQHKNRERAWKRMKARVEKYEFELLLQSHNNKKNGQLTQDKTWTWTDYRDEVKNPSGAKYSMSSALRGDLTQLLM